MKSTVRKDTQATARRKTEHIRINLEQDVQFKGISTGLERYRFVHQALPEIDAAAIDTSTRLFGKTLQAPLIISSMTGGVELGGEINQRLAQAAQITGVAMGVGSQRAAIENPDLARFYQVREVAPDILLLANLGAVQLNYGYGILQCLRAVEMIQADGLILHLNPLQEMLQPEGNTDFSGLLRKIEEVCRRLPVPVVVKEVGWGISTEAARQLAGVGVAAIDVAGAGGTSWSEVEKHRALTGLQQRTAATFADWGVPTVEALLMARQEARGIPVIASGGIRTGIDVAKCIALGASATGLAAPMLHAAAVSTEAVSEAVRAVVAELRISMFCIGAASLAELSDTPHLQPADAGIPRPSHQGRRRS